MAPTTPKKDKKNPTTPGAGGTPGTPVTPDKKSPPHGKGNRTDGKLPSRGRMVGRNKKYANQIDVHPTASKEIAVSIAHKPKDGAGGTFTFYIKKVWLSQAFLLSYMVLFTDHSLRFQYHVTEI